MLERSSMTLWGLILLAAPLIVTADPVRIAIMKDADPEKTLSMWRPTATYLADQLPGHDVELTVLGAKDLEAAVEQQRVEFVFAQPILDVELEVDYGLSRIATVETRATKGTTTLLGGVIFTLAKNNQIKTLYDLKSQSVLAVDPSSLGGWVAAWRDLLKLGIRPYKDFSTLEFAGTHEAVVNAVNSGTVAVGVVRTGTLERMAQEGQIILNEFRVLNNPLVSKTSQHLHYPFLHNTRLYPEWAFSTLPHTNPAVAKKIATVLIQMPATHPAALAAGYAGWSVPLNYHPVQELLKELRLRPYDKPERISFARLFEQYWHWILLSALLIGAMALVITHMVKLNRRINQAKHALENEAIERYRAESVLRQTEDRFRNLVETTHDVVWETDQDGVYTYISPQAEALLGYKVNELIGKYPHDLIHADQLNAIKNMFQADDHRPIESVEYELAHKNGHRIVLQSSAMPFFHVGGQFLGYRGISRDVTNRKHLDESLHQEKERAQVTVESIADGVVTTDVAGHIEYMNPVACELTGWSQSRARGRPLLEVLNLVDDLSDAPITDHVVACLTQGRSVLLSELTMLVRRNGDKKYHVEMSLSPLRNRQDQVIGIVSVFRDRTEMRQLVKQMAFQASHDSLTGLINRYEFEKLLSASLHDAKTLNAYHVLCYLDLDQFKIVNDTCGHTAGDHLLTQLAQQLKLLMRPTDAFARLGGDEFGVLIANSRISEARKVIDSICKFVKDYRFIWQNRAFELGVSVGVVSVDANSGTLNDVLSAADSACYVAKEQGRNRVYVYQSDDATFHERQGQMQWVHRIRHSFEQERFFLHYQNVVGLLGCAGDYRHCEILLRMRDDNGNEIAPMSFIPSAERYHMMPRIDRWVTRTTFQFIKPHIELFKSAQMMFAINLSGQSLCDDHFLNFIINQLEKTGVPPEMLCFEITETAAIANLSRAMRFIGMLKGMGCKFSLDDFGSGLSSFAYLKSLPVDYLKIDGSFVKTMLQDPVNFAMVESVNQIGHLMGLKTVAEFVEGQGVFDKLKLMGVDYAQGHAIGYPRPLELLFADLAVLEEAI